MSESIKRVQKIDDNTRVNKVLIELSNSITQSSSSEPVYQIENQARDLLLEYANELTSAVLEEACLLAKHRKSKEISANDVNLILAKKLGIELPGMTKINKLHRHAFSSTGSALSSSEFTSTTQSLKDSDRYVPYQVSIAETLASQQKQILLRLQKEQRQKSENYKASNTEINNMNTAPLKKKNKRKSEKISSITDINSSKKDLLSSNSMEITTNQSITPSQSTIVSSSSINVQQNFNFVKNNNTNNADILSI